MSNPENTPVERLELAPIGPDAGDGAALVPRDLKLVEHVNVEVKAIVGEGKVSLERLFALKRGDALELDQDVQDPVVVEVAGKPVARGHLVAIGDRFGVQITELV
jgi:flagellar motor switch protein FliN/FliY